MYIRMALTDKTATAIKNNEKYNNIPTVTSMLLCCYHSKNGNIFLRSDILMVIQISIVVLWIVTPRALTGTYYFTSHNKTAASHLDIMNTLLLHLKIVPFVQGKLISDHYFVEKDVHFFNKTRVTGVFLTDKK